MPNPPRSTPSSPAHGHGLVLVPGPARSVSRWLRRGLVAVRVADYGAWTGICLADSPARAAAPYDVGLQVLAAAPAPMARRPCLGFFVIAGRAVITVQVRGWRASHLWLVWEPGTGLRDADLAPIPPSVLIRASGAAGHATLADVKAILSSVEGTPVEWLLAVLDLLQLPGADLLVHGEGPQTTEIEPSPRAVRAFDAMVAEDRSRHPELTGDDLP